ncbi:MULTISPECIES: DegV family protein [unclassified Streptococcus]|uniref:DegV family protein n=1 Tax=unclassified Streptococcus TaxID=2608887 RepID=UPI001072DB51|nr:MULTISPECIES: DegV family protein [unclassified Streptococcus]MBF0787245.1 DegV family protein [Streptococcus sp. 19428wC2_LYSM12]MCQ9211931.1 DegV family protein [Streptococcus sp. B01]MCQ9213258.1 DegV family protein [Streptococcus sp. O1]TFV05873.1 DegV family protein [Streptococcus sp. LYSM12]
MVQFKIVTDSTSDVPVEWIEQYDLEIMGLTVELDGIVYETVGENRLTSDVLLEKMRAGGQPTTSQVNVGQFEALFRKHAKANQAVLYLAFSAALSGTYQSAVMAREIVMDDYPEAVIEIIDTKAATLGEAYLVLKAAKARELGMSLTDTVAIIEDVIPRLRTYLLVDDLHHLVRGGRLSKTAALIGGLVNIKPLISIDSDGKLVSIAKLRGKKKGIKEMLGLTLERLDASCVMVAYTGDIKAAEQLRDTLLADQRVEQVMMEPLGPIIASHTGTGSLAILSIGRDQR